jgi:hypothetical protein
MHEVQLIFDATRLSAVAHAPVPVLGERQRRAQHDLSALLGEAGRALRNLRFVADVDPDRREFKLDCNEIVASLNPR